MIDEELLFFMSPHTNYLVRLEHSTKKWETCTQIQFSVLPDGALRSPTVLEVFHIIGKFHFLTSRYIIFKNLCIVIFRVLVSILALA